MTVRWLAIDLTVFYQSVYLYVILAGVCFDSGI